MRERLTGSEETQVHKCFQRPAFPPPCSCFTARPNLLEAPEELVRDPRVLWFEIFWWAVMKGHSAARSRERQRQRHRQRDRERQRQRHRQTDRQTETYRQTDRQTEQTSVNTLLLVDKRSSQGCERKLNVPDAPVCLQVMGHSMGYTKVLVPKPAKHTLDPIQQAHTHAHTCT